jgi:hypothetical protein
MVVIEYKIADLLPLQYIAVLVSETKVRIEAKKTT